MAARTHLLRAIALENFMLHRETALELSRCPVLLLTGANGSGKTQILDAMLLAMGHHPKRVKKGSLTTLIGAFGDSASVRLRLGNPAAGGEGRGRALRIESADLARLLDHDEVEIVARIEPESGLSYSLVGGGRSKRIRRQDVRSLFDAAGVSADNRLAFTEEGTVNVFADHSARAKLEWILETTGLAAYRNNLLEAIERTERALTQIEPMRSRLRIERDYLASLERNLELARRRAELETRHGELLVEEAWSRVAEAEGRLEKAERRVEAKEAERQRARADLEESTRERASHEARLADLESREALERESLAEVQSRVDRAAGRLASLGDRTRALEGQRKRLAGDLEATDAPDDPAVVARRERIAGLEETLAPYLESGYFRSSRIPIRRTILSAHLFARRAAEVGLELLAGPLIGEIDWPDDPDQRRAVAGLIGPGLFSFLVADEEDLAVAHTLLLDTWPHRLPPIVLRVDDHDPDPPDVPEGVAPLEDLVEEGGPAWRLLLKAVHGGLAPAGLEPDELRRLALDSGRSLVRPDGPDYFLADGGVGGAFDPRLETLEPDRLAAEALEEAESLRRELDDLRLATPAVAQAPDEALRVERRRRLEERLAEIDGELAAVATESEGLAATIAGEESAVAKCREVLAGLDDDRKEVRGRRGRAEERIERLRGTVEGAEVVLDRYGEEVAEARAALAAGRPEAEAAGDRPRAVRDRRTVHDERIRVETQLEEARASRISLERHEEQKAKVAAMEAELAGSSEHIENLRSDMKERFDAWHGEVTDRIGRMAEGVNRLLAGVYDGVQLRVENLHDAVKAGFQMEVRRRGKDWRDLAHLSGGEKVLAVEALILSMHLLADSPIHAIDEFTQRLDLEFKAYALDMVVRTVAAADKALVGPYAPQFLLLCPDTIGIDFDPEARRVFQRVVITSARSGRGKARESAAREVGA